jgi:hypothetical protein
MQRLSSTKLHFSFLLIHADKETEMSASARALCQSAACKNQGVKIQKGEFRMGNLIFFQEHTTWKWKHWYVNVDLQSKAIWLTRARGCVTPLQIKNLQDQVGPLEDFDDLDEDLSRIIDGYDEIDDEFREKIKFALQNGHVPDEDWKGVWTKSLATCMLLR